MNDRDRAIINILKELVEKIYWQQTYSNCLCNLEFDDMCEMCQLCGHFDFCNQKQLLEHLLKR
jgi:hypothetical protein